jgi:coenzyme Q-binding protein COQ10
VPTHKQQKTLPYSQDQLFDLVASIEEYPQFLPWCVGARIKKRDEGINDQGNPCEFVIADLSVRFKVFRETFASRVMLDKENHRIIIEYLDGPFKHLENKWAFDLDNEGTRIDFFIDFEFKSKPLQLLIGSLFGTAVKRMMQAFEDRAAVVFVGEKSNT